MTTRGEFFFYEQKTTELIMSLTPAERIFTYYMFRANLPFNRMCRDQNHRYTNEILELCEYLYDHKDQLDANFGQDLETFLVYLWADHGIYFMREHANNKRTPARIGLTHLTAETLTAALKTTGYPKDFVHLIPIIFDAAVDAEMCVDGSIEKSGNNYYGPGMTNEAFKSLPAAIQNRINAYCHLVDGQPSVEFYGVTGKYAHELQVTVNWLARALHHARKYPEHFDAHMIAALEHLLDYYASGDEECFKKHSIEWLQARSRILVTQGFIENYCDPMKIRGEAASEVTIRTVDLDRITPMLLQIEDTLPNPAEFKRDIRTAPRLNVSINQILHGSGHYGPQLCLAAYCLPNYEDIRSTHGSKQIIYPQSRSLGGLLNPELSKQFRTKAQKEFIQHYDPNDTIYEDLWDLQVLLHETIGHASGKLATHTFQEPKKIGEKMYQPGETIQVTDANIGEFIGSEGTALEELRAEINALYMGITSIEPLNQAGLYKDWLKVLGPEKLQEMCIIGMCRHSFRRYLEQSENMDRINGAHSRANVTIMNYLLASGGIRINEEVVTVDNQAYHLLEIQVMDRAKCLASTTELLQRVQRIKSTGDYWDCQKLFDTFTVWPVTLDQARRYRKYMDDIRKKLVGSVRAMVRVFPTFEPVIQHGEIVDMRATPCTDFIGQNWQYDRLMMSTY